MNGISGEKNNNIDKIKARVFNLEDAPDEYKKVLY